MNEEKKSYYAIIPANIRYDKNLPDKAKLLYGEITALCNEKGYCWASNEYFSSLYEVTDITISRLIKCLIDNNHIAAEYIYRGKSKIIEKRILKMINKNDNQMVNKNVNQDDTLINKNDNQMVNKNVKENNTIFNNTIFNNTVEYILFNLLNYWIECKMPAHKKETLLSEIKKKHKDLIQAYGEDTIKKAILNYSIVVKDNRYWFSYQWTFWDFIARGLHKFIDESKPLENYLKEEFKNKNKSYEEEYMKKNADIIDNL